MRFITRSHFVVKNIGEFVPDEHFIKRFDPMTIKYLGENFRDIMSGVICPPEVKPCDYGTMTLSWSTVGPKFYDYFGSRCVVSFSLIWHLLVSHATSDLNILKTNGSTNIFVVRNLRGHLYSVGCFWYKCGWSIRAYPFVPKGDRVRNWFAGNQIIVKDPKFVPSSRLD